jgi:23S rRNA (adenine2030-N6)-methyltransferase
VNYRHGYHAGSFTDVFKHIILTALMTSLSRKDSPFCYIDTHAGTGYYDLFSDSAKKTREYESGIEKIIQQENPPPLIKRYLDCVHKINNQLTGSTFASLRYYPGSPMIARYLSRPHDQIIACELQRQEYEALRSAFSGDKQVSVHHMDGFLGLKAFLPPKLRRGLVLIDPPYEDPDEFNHIANSMPVAIKRWNTGIYAIWYPVKDKAQVSRFYRTLREKIDLPIYSIELTIYPDLPNHLNGSGVAIINPPWQFDQSIDNILPWCWNALTINGQGSYQAQMLK